MRALASELPIATSVQGIRAAKYVDAAGRVRCTTSRWQRMAVVDVNMHQRLVHTDGLHVALRGAAARDSLLALQRACGDNVTVSTLDEENLALLEWHGESARDSRASPTSGCGYARPGGRAIDAALATFRASVFLTVDDAIAAFSLRRYAETVAECRAAVAAARAAYQR